MRTAVFHGVEIPETLIAREAQNHPGLSAGEARRAAGDALATKALLLARAQAMGLTPQPEPDEDGRLETEESALIRAVLEAEVVPPEPGEAECRRVFESRRPRTPDLYEAAHILTDNEGAALGLVQELSRRPERFAALAEAYSLCPSGGVGGSLGQLSSGDLAPEVEAALLALVPGQIGAEPVRSRFGWHVVRLDRRIDGRDIAFEEVEDQIRDHLRRRGWDGAAARYLLDLAEAAAAQGVALSLADDGAVEGPAPFLGALIGQGAEADRLLPWLAAADAGLAARVEAAAEDAGMAPAEFVRAATREFVNHGGDEAWTKVISAARDAEDPALAALAAILATRLAPPPADPAAPPDGARRFTVISRRQAA
ncbi:MAG TPA: peptidylprolyl isomerase [Caulobacteraceae bacterium]|nr:peptidylprolyl isomerase [Caulobacteraceae bacterium]